MPSIMSGNAKNRKPKYNNSRGGRSKFGNSPNSLPISEGVYSNPRLIHSLTSLVGTKGNVQVKNGGLYQGIFHTISPSMDMVIGASHKLEGVSDEATLTANGSQPRREDIIDELIFKSKDIVCVMFQDVDLKHALAPVKANGDAPHETIAPSTNGEPTRVLEPWDGGGDGSDIGGIEDDLTGTGTSPNGWAPEEMFRTNSEQYGVKSSYDANLPEYTVQLKVDDSEEFQLRKAHATKIANEIEGSSTYQKHIEVELDDTTTEEEKFSSVVREPHRDRPRNDRNDRGWSGGRARGRGKDAGRYGGYSGPGGMSRGQHAPGNYSLGSGQSVPTSPNDPPATASLYGKSSSGGKSPSNPLPPRFNKQASGGSMGVYNRDEDRPNRQHDQGYHSSFGSSQPKHQRQGPPRPHPKHYQSSGPDQHSGPPADVTSGRATPQQAPSRSSSSSSAPAIQQPMTSMPWGAKQPPPLSGDARAHPNVGHMARPTHYQPAPVKEKYRQPGSQRIAPRILSRNAQQCRYALGRRPCQYDGYHDSSYSAVLQSGPVPGKMPTALMPSAAPPGSYVQDNRTKQIYPTTNQVSSASRSPNTTYVYSPKGHTPPAPPVPATAMHPRDPGSLNFIPPQTSLPHHQGTVRPVQVTPTAHYIPAPSSAASMPGQPPRRSSTDTKADPKSSSSRKSIDGSSHHGDEGSSKHIKQELKEFQQNFRLSDTAVVGDSSKGPSPSQAKQPLPQTSSAAKPHAYKGPRPQSGAGQTPSRHSSRETPPSQHSQPQVTPPGPQPSHPIAHHHVIAQPTHHPQTVLVAAPQTQAAQLPTQPHHHGSQPTPPPPPPPEKQDMVMVYQTPPSVMTYPAALQQPVQILATEQSVVTMQPAINVHSPRSGTQAAPAVNTVSAATGPFVSQQPPVVSATDTHHQQPQQPQAAVVTPQQASDPAAAPPSSATGGGDAGGAKPIPGKTPTSASAASMHQLNPDAQEFTPRSFVQKATGVSTPTSPTALATHQMHQQPFQYATATPSAVIVNLKKPRGHSVISPPGADSVVPHMATHLQTTSTHPAALIPAGPHQYPAPAQFILATPGPQQVAVGQTAPHFSMDQVIYAQTAAPVMQPGTPRAVPGVYATESQLYATGYTQGHHPVHIQAQQPTAQPTPPQPGQHSQQPSPPQQQAQAGYMQQARPHSAHTPNPGIPPASPAASIPQTLAQPQTGVIVGNPPPQLHPPAVAQSAQVLTANAQGFYPQPTVFTHHPHMQAQIHGSQPLVANSPHGQAYTHFPAAQYHPHQMMLRGGQPMAAHGPNPSAPQGFIQQTSVVTSTPGQTHHQYVPQRQQAYAPQPMIPAYQQASN